MTNDPNDELHAPIKWMYKSTCDANDGLVTLIEPWKEQKAAEQYESRDCETVTILSFEHP